MRIVWVLWEKLLKVQVVAGPGGSANTPLGTRKPSQILREGDFFPLQGALKGIAACTTLPLLAHAAEPSGSQAHLKEPHCSGV